MGSPWRDVPECYGSWRAVYGLFRRWQRAWVWAAIMIGLQADADARSRSRPTRSAIARTRAAGEADYEAIVQIAAINDWLTCLCDTP